MPLSRKIYSFPETDPVAFKGLPGMIADSLPDDFGNAVLNAWIASQGKSTDDFTQVRSGQADVPKGFTHFIIKFDGVSEHNKNKETFGDPMGYGTMEYIYHLMAKACGIDMMPCRLLIEGDRRHFITQRFDRDGNEKRHVQTLNGLAHISYKKAGSYSYAELFAIARELKLSPIFSKRKIDRIIEETTDHVSRWNDLAAEHSVPHSLLKLIGSNLLLTI